MIPTPDIILHWDLRTSKLIIDDAGEPFLQFEIPVTVAPRLRLHQAAVMAGVEDELADRSSGEVLKYHLEDLQRGSMKGAPKSSKYIAKVTATLV